MVTMIPEERRTKHREFYYKHHERYRASARERQRLKRADRKESPEEAEGRRAYHRAYYATKTGPAFAAERANRRKAEERELAEIVPLAEPVRTQFKLILIGLLADRRKVQDDYRRAWKRKKFGWKARGPKAVKGPKPPKPARVQPTREQINECQNALLREHRKNPEWVVRRNRYKRAHLKLQLEKAKSDPNVLAELRARRRAGAKRWIQKMRTQDPERYKAWLKREWESERTRRETNPQRRLSVLLRTQVYAAIRRQLADRKALKSLDLVGCSVEELIDHLEKQFQPGMKWANFGRGTGKWCIDHRKPCASFHLSRPEEQKQAFHFSNLQPMWFSENCAKSSVWEGRRWSSLKTCQPSSSVQTPTT